MSMKASYFEERERLIRDDPLIAFAFGLRAELGWGRRRNLELAINFYELSAKKSLAQAYYRKWICLQKINQSGKSDTRDQFDCLMKAATLGYPPAEFDLFQIGPGMYGLTVSEAENWLKKAVSHNYIQAELFFATRLEENFSDLSSKEIAKNIFFRLAEQGVPEAKYSLGKILITESKSIKDAITYIKEAAKMQYMPALSFLASSYQDGLYGLKKDKLRAAIYQQKSQLVFEKTMRKLRNLSSYSKETR